MTPKKTGAKSARAAPNDTTDRKTPAAGEHTETPNTGRRPWKKKSVAEHILGQIDKLRDEVAEKERDYLQTKQQLDKLEQLREGLENQ
jgi:hypothetical protein